MTTTYSWEHSRRYNDYTSYFKAKFSHRVQKIALNAGFSCPNRDGSIGTGGCTYCNNFTFNPTYCQPEKSVTQQLNEGVEFFYAKYQAQQYLAYFQAYTNTYGDYNNLIQLYQEALSHPKVIGLVIATRPDCIDNQLLDYLSELAKTYYVIIEYGIESTNNESLVRINRGHTFEVAAETIRKTHEKGIFVGVHLILGLPFESREILLSHAEKLSELPIKTLKIHHLQIIKDTVMAKEFESNPSNFHIFDMNEYIELVVDFLEQLSPSIIVERFVNESPAHLVVTPHWNKKNFEIVSMIEKRLAARNTWQGKNYKFL